jgi:hypothetical protein
MVLFNSFYFKLVINKYIIKAIVSYFINKDITMFNTKKLLILK